MVLATRGVDRHLGQVPVLSVFDGDGLPIPRWIPVLPLHQLSKLRHFLVFCLAQDAGVVRFPGGQDLLRRLSLQRVVIHQRIHKVLRDFAKVVRSEEVKLRRLRARHERISRQLAHRTSSGALVEIHLGEDFALRLRGRAFFI